MDEQSWRPLQNPVYEGNRFGCCFCVCMVLLKFRLGAGEHFSLSMKFFYLLAAFAAGIMMPVQAGINALLGGQLRSPFLAALVSFCVGSLVLALFCLFLRVPLPGIQVLSRIPVWMFAGGLLGAFFVTTTIILAPKLGAVTLLASLITAQMVASLILDHFGLIGYPVHQVNVWRILGVACLITGVFLVQKF